MSYRAFILAGSLSAVSGTAQPASGADAAGAPFSAHYQADWKNINVGTSDLELKQDAASGNYVYTWKITARGVFRLYRAEVTQQSWISIVAGHVRPEKYRAEDGASAVSIDFDWNSRRARGTSENKPVDLELKDGTQDVMSIQVEVMLDLKNGNLPKTFQIVDKDELKEFIYSQEGDARISTDLGELDTVIVASRRAGNNRLLRMWFAPSLGFIPVRAERTRDGKLEFAMRIKSLKR
ncbi:MAG TPA: DUF3108 domain-containing protein [Steroidobacteraceae bacterium]|jgi:hypothetical protein|nr:DUF3108 domain-containing protein [Steroidobacteraceae bacterium]